MSRYAQTFWTSFLAAIASALVSWAAFAQVAGNPLLGAWSWQAMDQNTGGIIASTVVYKADGTFFLTYRLPNGTLGRVWGSYQTRQVGQNQWQVAGQPMGALPRQICANVAGAGTTCRPFAAPQQLPTEVVTFTSPNSFQNGSLTAYRDPSPVLAGAFVPETAVQTVAAAPPGPGGYGGGAPGAQMCSLGAAQCFAGWRRTCEVMPGSNGATWWKTSANRC